MPMAIETESVKPRLGSSAQIRPLAAVALDTQGCARSVGIVVVACEAIDRAMFVVREIELQPARAAQGWLAERSVDRCGEKGNQRRGTDRHRTHDEGGMPPEHQDRVGRRLPCTLRRTPCAQQHNQGADRGRDVQSAPADAAEVAGRNDHMHRDERRQQASQDHVRGLKASMACPETAPQRAVREEHEQDEQEGRRDAGELIKRSGGLEILENGVVGEHQAADMKRRQNERRVTDRGVQAQGQKRRRLRVPWPDRSAAEENAGKGGCQAGPLGKLPRRTDEAGNRGESEQHDERAAQEGGAPIKTRQEAVRRSTKAA